MEEGIHGKIFHEHLTDANVSNGLRARITQALLSNGWFRCKRQMIRIRQRGFIEIGNDGHENVRGITGTQAVDYPIINIKNVEQ